MKWKWKVIVGFNSLCATTDNYTGFWVQGSLFQIEFGVEIVLYFYNVKHWGS